MIIKLLAQDW